MLQIMTHGIGFDRTYWDLPVHDYEYSYVARAVDDHGYSTVTWDRLGVGQSSRGETINEIQTGSVVDTSDLQERGFPSKEALWDVVHGWEGTCETAE